MTLFLTEKDKLGGMEKLGTMYKQLYTFKLGKHNDLVIGGNFMQDQGIKLGSYENRYRLNGGLNIFKKHQGQLMA